MICRSSEQTPCHVVLRLTVTRAIGSLSIFIDGYHTQPFNGSPRHLIDYYRIVQDAIDWGVKVQRRNPADAVCLESFP
jgi:hypothetical protein